MELNSIQVLKDFIKKDFVLYLQTKERSLTPRVQDQYLRAINNYIENYIEESAIVDYKSFFAKHLIKKFLENRTGSTARAVLTNFLEFLRDPDIDKIDSDSYLRIKETLQSVKKTPKEKLDFLTEEDIDYIMHDTVYSKKQNEEKLLTPLLVTFAYNMLFEQDHIYKLKWNDVDIKNRKIRNLRHDHDKFVDKWMDIDDDSHSIIEKYYNTFIGAPYDEFVIIKGEPANNQSVNKMLHGVFRSTKNRSKLTTTVDVQKLIRSRILIDLRSTEGKSLMKFYEKMGLKKNTQLENALHQYLQEQQDSKQKE
ncbi:hypothetical protein ACWKW1_24490 [Brevibacillus parabrevis]